ncbi:hypothetical protein [Pseudomonas aeruginosa]|uniref:hypothetical protein n=1 Tax=Pseudomonas aeruginosa TaxID=287 RepID=UPI00053D7303|nr:hypothetical protein [Pseudomonas aeruginosa]
MKIDRAVLERAAIACRRGLLKLSGKSGSIFYRFPRGACGPASEILGRLLKEEFDYDGVYVCGNDHPQLGREQSHAWLEVGEFLLDITHDQFKETGLSGWVFERGGEWHELFSDTDTRPGFCAPANWPCYPHDGYQAALAELSKGAR